MKERPVAARWRHCAAASLWILVAGCSSLRPQDANPPAYYSLDRAGFAAPAQEKRTSPPMLSAATLLVSPPRAAAGYDSRRILYVRTAHQLEYFARSEWVDTPARMLATLIVSTIQRGGSFLAVMPAPSAAAGELRLDTEIVRLQHEFGRTPSQVRFTLRAHLVDSASRNVVASRQFDATVAAPSENPYGGVLAANEAVRSVLEQLEAFCAEAVASRALHAGEQSRRQ
jgi:cholesterol transport system auxiliary component